MPGRPPPRRQQQPHEPALVLPLVDLRLGRLALALAMVEPVLAACLPVPAAAQPRLALVPASLQGLVEVLRGAGAAPPRR